MGRRRGRRALVGGACPLIAAAFVYPVLATSARTVNRTSPRSLDGIAYMANESPTAFADCTQVGGGSDAGDDAAIRWLNAHIDGSPVIVEAPAIGIQPL